MKRVSTNTNAWRKTKGVNCVISYVKIKISKNKVVYLVSLRRDQGQQSEADQFCEF